jgi:acyl carrier protein
MSWTHQSVLAELTILLADHTDAATDVSEKTELVGDLGIDSPGVMELVADIEDKFDMTISDAELRDVATLGDVVGAIEKRLRQEGRMQE